MKLYTYFRSSAAYRVRIALHLKGLCYEAVPVHLVEGQQKLPSYQSKNPLGLVPTLTADSQVFTQSLAIIEWLEEVYPNPALLPQDNAERARVRAIANTIVSDIHPLNNLRVLTYLSQRYGISEQQKNEWYQHWVYDGLMAVEQLLKHSSHTGTFCHGEAPGIADCCLVPQVFNARRFECPLDDMQTIKRIVAACESIDAFQRASPAEQPDAE